MAVSQFIVRGRGVHPVAAARTNRSKRRAIRPWRCGFRTMAALGSWGPLKPTTVSAQVPRFLRAMRDGNVTHVNQRTLARGRGEAGEKEVLLTKKKQA